MGITVIASMYGFYLMIAFPCLKAAFSLFPKSGWIIQWIIWCAYEYIKTCGFAGFHYGVTGYSQWENSLLIQNADWGGVWGISALIVFPSAIIAQMIYEVLKSKKNIEDKKNLVSIFKDIKESVISHRISCFVWLVLFVASLVYGIFSKIDYSNALTVKIALIQPNNDPWRGGIEAYAANYEQLVKLSDEALKADPDIDLVVWPETAFVPRIEYHYKYRQKRESFELVEKLLNYLDNAPVPFLIGNDHAVLGYSRTGRYEAIDYNSALLFMPKENCIPPNPQKYMKMHLVPFTEYFPYEKIFPKLYERLLNGDTHMWEPGTVPVVFEAAGFKFGTPICFEDTFGYIGRKFVKNGAESFINISNDAWSKSLACQYQHLSMAVFRCVENRVSAARATASGQTSFVDPNGKVIAMAEPFQKTYLIEDLPIHNVEKQTIYTCCGDFVGVCFALLGIGFLVFGIIRSIKTNKRGEV
jgi:apolipoprotein N-acyltransferase